MLAYPGTFLMLLFACLTTPSFAQIGILAERSSRDTTTILNHIHSATELRTQYPDSAINILEIALQDSRASGFHYGTLLAMYRLAGCYTYRGKNTEAIAMINFMLTHCRPGREQLFIAPVLNDMGNIKQDIGQFEEALQYYLRAEKANEQYRAYDSVAGSIYNNIAIVLLKMDQVSQAFPYLEKAAAIATRDKNYRLLINALSNKGLAYMMQKDYQESETWILKALQTVEQHRKGSAQHANILVAMGTLYLNRELPQKALPYLEEAIRPSQEINAGDKITALGNIGIAWFQQKEYAKAIRYYKEVVGLSERSGYQDAATTAYKMLADAYASLHRYEDAYTYSWLYFGKRDSISGERVADNVNRIEVQFRTALKDKEIAEKKLLLSQQDKRIAKKNLWIIAATSGILLLAALLLIFYGNARNKRRAASGRMQLLQQEQKIGQLKAMMEGEEKERLRVSRDLHDGIGGMIAALKMGFSTLQERHELQDMKEFNDMMHLLDETGSELRKTAHNLMPEILARQGLEEALKQYLLWKKEAWKPLHIELQVHGVVNDLPDTLQLTLFRIVQEVIKNIVQHAGAKHVLVQLNKDEDNVLSLMIEDDGIGFDTTQPSKGIGLQNIRNRVSSQYGSLSIYSRKDKGTIINIEFDLNNNTVET